MRRLAAASPLLLALLTTACVDSPAEPTGACFGAGSLDADTTIVNIAYADDCEGPLGTLGDVYQFTLTAQTNILFTQNSSGFLGGLTLFKGQFTNLGQARLIFDVVGAGTVGAKAYLPAGDYFVVAGSAEQKGGSYTLVTAPTSSTPCSDAYFNYTVRGADIAGQLDNSDCSGATASVRQDAYSLWLYLGETITVTTTYSKAGVMSFRRAGFPGDPDIGTNLLTANNPVTATYAAPDARDPFNIHIIGEPPNTGTGTYLIQVR